MTTRLAPSASAERAGGLPDRGSDHDHAAVRPGAAVVLVAAALYLGSVVAANWLTVHVGFVPVGLGQDATAGTLAIGAALVVRDVLQDAAGRLGVAGLILTAGGLSFLVADRPVAVASLVAFLLSESLDMAVYTPLRRRGRFGSRWWQAAVLTGAVAGSLVDSIAFLTLAFGHHAVLPALPGQLLGKAETALVVLGIGTGLRAVLREPLDRAGA